MTTPQQPMSDDERLARLARLDQRAAQGRPSSPTTAARATATTGRHHAANGSRALALAVSVGTTIGLAGWLDHEQAAADAALTAATTATSATSSAGSSSAGSSSAVSTTASPATSTASTTASPATSASSETTIVTEAPATTATTSSGLADGTYVGDTDTNRWGPVQVQITVEGGVITAVDVLQSPSGDHTSIQINDQAVPWLVSETLAAQSADVDTVSGATYTSDSYRQSLQTAIDQARAAATS